MKKIYILMAVLVFTALASGCLDKKQADKTGVPNGEAPVTPPAETVSPGSTPASSSNVDEFGTEVDITAIDSLVNDSSMDISFSDATI